MATKQSTAKILTAKVSTAKVTKLFDIELDEIYEAKCIPFVQPDDLFWIVGVGLRK